MFLLGDVNINVSDQEASDVRRYLQLLNDLSLHQLVSEPTHMLPRPTTLDHIITNRADVRATVKVLAESPSDHQPVVCSVPLPKIRTKPVVRETRRWERADWDRICLDLLLADWTPMFEAPDVDGKLSEFMRAWDDVIDQHCPVVRVRSGRVGSCPWIREDHELCELMSQRDRAQREWIRSRSDLIHSRSSRTDELHEKYRKLRNEAKSRLARARKEFLCHQLAIKDYRGFWSRFNMFAKNISAGNATPRSSDLDAAQAGAVILSLRTQVFCVRTLIWYSCLLAYATHRRYANFGILISSVRKIGILIFFAYAGGILGLFHVEGKINATGGMLCIYCFVLVPGTL